MWQLNVRGRAGEWMVEGEYPDLTAVTRRILRLEGDPTTGIFLSIHVLANLPAKDTEVLSELEYEGRRALLRRQAEFTVTSSLTVSAQTTHGLQLPGLFVPNERAARRFLEFFTAGINNDHTRRAYLSAARRFAGWCAGQGIDSLASVHPIHVAAFVKQLQGEVAAPTVKQHLAAIRMLFDWLVLGHIIDTNPAHAVRGPKHVVKKGKTPVLVGEEARALLDSINTSSLVGLRDRALIGLMTYSFARVGAVLKMQVRDYFIQNRRGHVRLHEKGGKEHEVPCHHELEQFLDAYIAAAGIAADPLGPLFRTSTGRSGTLNATALYQQDVFRMVRRRAGQAGIKTLIGNHTFRATGITAYLKNGGSLEMAQHIANHESPRTTKLYDRRVEEISQNEVERIRL